MVVVGTGIHVSTAEAYKALNRNVTDALTSPAESPILREFQTIAWSLDRSRLEQFPLKNDFEGPVFEMHRELADVARKLRRFGARAALMTGSGSAVFGLFDAMPTAKAAAARFPAGSAWAVQFVSRRQYRKVWRRALGSAAQASCFTHL